MIATTIPTTAPRDIDLTPNLILRHIAKSPASANANVFLLTLQGEPLCFMHAGIGGAVCKALNLADTIGTGSTCAAAATRALDHYAGKAREAAGSWANEMICRTDPIKRSEARGQLELAVARHDLLKAEIEALYGAIAEAQREAEAEEERAIPAEDETPF